MLGQLRRFSVLALAVAALVVLLGLTPAVAQAATYCVNQGPTGANGCWQNAYPTLQEALTAARPGDEIWVAKGVYTPGLTISDTFTVTSGVALYGGFAATETLRTQRDWVANVTVLSGDIGGDDLTDAHGVLTTTDNIVGANAYHVLWLEGTTTPIDGTTRVDGFVITGGQANASFPADIGGGLYCDGAGSGHICSPTIANVTFSGNDAYGAGGAMYNNGSHAGVSSPMLTGVIFTGNTSGYGVGMYNNGSNSGVSSPILTGVIFTGNSGARGAGMYNNGSDSGVSSPIVNSAIFTGNVASLRGGAIYNNGSAGASRPSFTNVIFSHNGTGTSGGAIYNLADDLGIGSATLTNVVFDHNDAGFSGGAIYNKGFDNGDANATLTNVTFSGNSAESYGGAIYNDAEFGRSTSTFTNVILWGNTAPADPQISSSGAVTLSIGYSIVQGGWVTGTHIVDADPLFMDAARGNFDLRPGSPAIDGGTNTGAPLFDIRDLPRPVNLITDIGAYESQGFDWVYLPAVRKER